MASFTRQQLEAELQRRRQPTAQEAQPQFTREQLMAERERRAAAAPAEAPDPLAAAPVEINGVPLSDDLRAEIVAAQDLEDPAERRRVSARIAGRVAAQQAGSRGEAALRGVGAGFFGLGDISAAAGTTLRSMIDGSDMSFGEALEAQREYRRALEEEFSGTSAIGNVAGALAGGGAAGKVLGAVGRRAGGRVARTIDAATRFKKGQTTANVGRAALAGGTAGGVTEAVLEGEGDAIREGVALGAVGGPAGMAAGRAIGAIATPLRRGLDRARGVTQSQVDEVLAEPNARGLKALAKRLGEPEGEIARRFLEFQEVTGRKPSIADIANPQAVAELRELIAASPSATAVAREVAEGTANIRAGELSEQITQGVPTTTAADIRQAADELANRQFGAIAQEQVTFQPDQVEDLLNNPTLRSAIERSPMRGEIDELINAASSISEEGSAQVANPVQLSIRAVDNIRQALNRRAGPGQDRIFRELAKEVEGIASEQVPQFREAIEGLARRRTAAEGVEGGRAGIRQPTTEFEARVRTARTPDEAGGIREGLRGAVADEAAESASRAARLVDTLSENGGLTRRLKAVLPDEEVGRLQRLARVQARSFENIERLSPGAVAQLDDDVMQAVEGAVNTMVAAAPTTSPALRIFSLGRILKAKSPLGLDDRVLENLARDAFDPDRTGAVLQALRRTNMTDEEILNAFAASVAGGQAVDEVVDQLN